MEISYIRIKNSKFTKDYTVRDASIVSGLVYKPEFNTVNMSDLEKLAIYFEQHLLADYLLSATPNSDLKKYKTKVEQSFNIKKSEILNSARDKNKLLKDNYLQERYLDTLLEYFKNPSSVSRIRLIDLCKALDKFKFDRCSFLNNFYEPYLSQNVYNTGKSFINPVLLTPKLSLKKVKDDFYRTPIILLPTSYNKNTYRKVNINKNIDNNKFYSYFVNMDFNNQSWQSIVDVLHKFNLSSFTIESLSNISGLLNCYLLGKPIYKFIDKSESKSIFLSLFNYIDRYNTLSTVNSNTAELVRLMSIIFEDSRFYYLLDDDKQLSSIETWNTYKDLACFTKFGLEAKENEDDSESEDTDSDQSDSDTDDSDASDTDTTDDDDADIDFDTDDAGGDESDDDFDFGDDSDSSDDSGSSDEGGSEDEAEPEDVNPLIQIIENESFDEYLERGLIEKKLLAIFKNPPPKLSANQLNTMKFWYAQWFPLVSVETTKLILGSLLDIKVDEDD